MAVYPKPGQRPGDNNEPCPKGVLKGQYKNNNQNTSYMSQSLSKLYVHAISHAKNNECLLRPEHDEELYAYIGGVIKLSKSIPISICGVGNHIHGLFIMSKNISIEWPVVLLCI